MGFIGAINEETRRWLGNNAAEAFDGRFVVVGCSGNFTYEQIISRYSSPSHLRGNDVSLYSSLLGAYLTDTELRLEIRDERVSFVEPFIEDPEGKAAVVMIMSEALQYEPEKNLYQKRLWRHYRENFKSYHQATIERLRKRRRHIRMDRYTSQDIGELLEGLPEEAVVVAFLPTYAGGYEKIYKRMEELFSWERPDYRVIDKERKEEIIHSLCRYAYIYIDDQRREDLPLAAVMKKRGMKTVYVYSNISLARKYYVRNRMGLERVSYERLNDGHVITESSRLTVIPTNNKVINYFRNLYLKKGIDYVNGDACFLAFVDKKLLSGPGRLLSRALRQPQGPGGRAGGGGPILILYRDDMGDDERTAVQLIHNAIEGEDDLEILKALWESIESLDWKIYAGLDSMTLGEMDKIEFEAISEQRIEYKSVSFLFLPEEVERAIRVFEEIHVLFRNEDLYIFSLKEWEKFFSLVSEIKTACNIKNSAAAFVYLLDLAESRMNEMRPQEE